MSTWHTVDLVCSEAVTITSVNRHNVITIRIDRYEAERIAEAVLDSIYLDSDRREVIKRLAQDIIDEEVNAVRDQIAEQAAGADA